MLPLYVVGPRIYKDLGALMTLMLGLPVLHGYAVHHSPRQELSLGLAETHDVEHGTGLPMLEIQF